MILCPSPPRIHLQPSDWDRLDEVLAAHGKGEEAVKAQAKPIEPGQKNRSAVDMLQRIVAT